MKCFLSKQCINIPDSKKNLNNICCLYQYVIHINHFQNLVIFPVFNFIVINYFKDTSMGLSEIFCMVTDSMTLCPIETSPKSLVARPLSEMTTSCGLMAGQCTSRYKVLCTLKIKSISKALLTLVGVFCLMTIIFIFFCTYFF